MTVTVIEVPRATLQASGDVLLCHAGYCGNADLYDSWLVDRPAWTETLVDLADQRGEEARLAALQADIDRCRQGGRPVYKRLPPRLVSLPTFTTTRGGVRLFGAAHLMDGTAVTWWPLDDQS